MKPSRSRFLDVRDTRYHVREWGRSGAPQLFVLHGWGDVAASFQFVVDALAGDWQVIAPDWRGFGQSARNAGSYWFPDYLADLDALLTHYSPDQPVRLIGHSMGGNVACLYAGVRPERVARLAALDAFGLPDRPPSHAPERLRTWLEQLAAPRAARSYADRDAFVRRLMRDNPRLTAERAEFLAQHLGMPDDAGGVCSATDPAHRNLNPVLYRRAEAESCWREIRAPVLWVVQATQDWRRAVGLADDVYDAARRCFRDFREVAIADSGHNFHHDQPERIAATLEAFFCPDT